MTRYKYDGGKNDGQYEAWNAQKLGRPKLDDDGDGDDDGGCFIMMNEDDFDDNNER